MSGKKLANFKIGHYWNINKKNVDEFRHIIGDHLADAIKLSDDAAGFYKVTEVNQKTGTVTIKQVSKK